jgi:hypothetical protein
MRKPKATVKTLRAELKALQAVLDKHKADTRAFVFAVKTAGRTLMTIAPANDKGMINGLTIPELVLLVNLKENEGEYVTLRTTNNKRDLVVMAQKNLPPTPWELL